MKETAGYKKPTLIKKKVNTAAPAKEIAGAGFVFDKENYRLLLIAIGFIVVGFILMIGGRSDSPDFFNYEMFNFQRLTLSPILLITGYVIGIFAIMKRPKKTNSVEQDKPVQ
ncbi:MAG: DUF3098 domain-containing protein [Bacteroidales bacterium]|nr:DUF3098 domain-containing protein [Bacteroidales bacterium]